MKRLRKSFVGWAALDQNSLALPQETYAVVSICFLAAKGFNLRQRWLESLGPRLIATVIRFSGPGFPGRASALHLLRPYGR